MELVDSELLFHYPLLKFNEKLHCFRNSLNLAIFLFQTTLLAELLILNNSDHALRLLIKDFHS